MEFILASNNSHKAYEFGKLFDANIIKVVPANNSKIEVEETGTSYFENALIKAKAFYDLYKKPVVSDDSGLNVIALPDELGIYSARFGGDLKSSKERYMLLLEKLKNIKNRKANFSCVLCFYISPEEIFFFEGQIDGVISDKPKGSHGFGYDPVFHPLNYSDDTKTLAEIPEWKEKNSHRAVACKHAIKFFKERNCQN